MRNYNQALDWLLEADRTLPVADWRVGEVDFWPLARAMIAVALHGDVGRPEDQDAAPAHVSPREARLRAAQASARLRRDGSWRGALSVEAMNGGGKDVPVEVEEIETLNANRLPGEMYQGSGISPRWLFVGNANLSQAIGGRATHRIFDPIAAEAAGSGVESVILISSPLLPGDRLARTPHHGIADSLYELRRLARHTGEPVSLPGLEMLIGLAPSPSVEGVLQRPVLEAAAKNLWQYASAIGELIDAWRIAVIFTTPYASLLGTALCAAGRIRGVPVIDIQHGLIGEPNPHYKLAVGRGLNTLPSHIWLWNDAGIVTPDMGSATMNFVGGNPFYALVATERQTHPEWAIAKEQGRMDVLVTLSKALIPAWLPVVVAQAPASWRWWVRLHPADFSRLGKWPDDMERLTRFPNVELRRAIELPLPILIEIADIHLTEGSSSALEARSAGVATIFYDQIGYQYFHGLPGGDRDRFCEPERLVTTLESIFEDAAFEREHERLEVNAARLRRAVRAILSRNASVGSRGG
jgi:hypothetical protein